MERTYLPFTNYISISFRLIGLLGDFVDRPDLYPELENTEMKKEYIEACINAIKGLKEKNTDIERILVTADSPIFLDLHITSSCLFLLPS